MDRLLNGSSPKFASCAHQGVRNVRFSENLVCFVSLKTCFEIRPFALLPTKSSEQLWFSDDFRT